MEILKVVLDDLRAKFHSKQELYNILSIDCKYCLLISFSVVLPAYNRKMSYFIFKENYIK